jgi:hypothetical protein
VASETEVLSRQKEVTERISTQVRTLGVSFLALVWLLLVPGKDGAPVLPHQVDKGLVGLAGAMAIAAMVLDFLQYFAAYLTVRHTLSHPVRAQDKPVDYVYDYRALRYKAQSWCLWLKQAALAVSFGSLVWAFWKAWFG